jgi:DNA-binding response OmpR family regulator
MAKKIVMVVDDEPPINKVVEDILGPEGYKVVSAVTGQEALGKLKRIKPALILIDFFMPGMSGMELCEKIRADDKLKSLKIAFLTAATFSQKGSNDLKRMNVKDYIKKPFDYQELIKRIKKIIG